MTQKEKNEMEILRRDNVELGETIQSLRYRIGGYKTSHESYRKKITELKSLVEHYKKLGLEGDELYEKKIAECDDLKKQLEEAKQVADNLVPKDKYDELEMSIENKNIFIEQLQDRIQKMSVEKSELETDLSVKKYEITTLVNDVNELKKPWWKKLF